MENLKVIEQVPESFELRYIPFLYNRPSFLSVNHSMPQLHFYLVNEAEASALAHIAFSREESEVMSPYKAPFAGLEWQEGMESAIMLFFLSEVIRKLREQNVRFVRLRLAPACYLPDADLIVENLQALGFDEKEALDFHAIPVDANALSSKIDPMEKRRLRKADRENLQFRFLDRSEFSSAFEFIAKHREAKGHVLSMDWEDLKLAIRHNPDDYLFAGVFMEKQLIAAAVLVRASARVIYNFYPAHDIDYNHLSPMVFLIGSLYIWCRQERVDFIDLGTSYIGAEVNESLVNFKEHMGGQVYVSRSFRKAISSL